jgi:hypothetical protein
MGINIIFFGRLETVPWDRRKTFYEDLHLFYSLSIITWGDQMRYGWGRGEVHAGFLWGNLGERDYLEELGVDGKILLKWVFGKWVGLDWTDVAQDRGKWRAVVNTVMNLQVSQHVGNFLTS